MKILVYDDNPDFGGHQIMASHGIQALLENPDLTLVFMIHPAHQKWAEQLPFLGNIQREESPCVTRKFQGFRNRINRRGIHVLKEKFKALNPDIVLCIQGDIEDASQGVLAAREAGIECVSYIAIPHRMITMGAKFGALRDRTNHYLLNQPDRYIAISESMKDLLVERGVTKSITIVSNGISPPPASNPKSQTSNHLTLGLLGRIEFNQKQQDFMVRTFCTHPDIFNNCRLLIAGSGPDETALRSLIKGKKNIELLPWTDSPESFYEQIDFLLLPSRFEGVPLVMLEALTRGIPTIGSRVDGMKDILPNAWTFEPENAESLVKTFSHVQGTWQDNIEVLRDTIQTKYSLESFKANFRNAVIGK